MLPPWHPLPLRQQIAQMIVVRASGHLFDHQIEYPAWEPPIAQLQTWIQDDGVGGVILLGGSAAEIAARTQQLQDWAIVPLLMAADIEEGVGQRFAGATRFPPPMAIGAIAQQNLPQAIAYARQMGVATAQEARAIGLNWVLAPVVDVNNNAANPVINVRAWGETPEIVSQLITAFIQGAQQYPVLTSAKHFPGHGDTAVDSHLALPVLPHDRDRLNRIELPPFQAAIAAGVDSVMTAHLQIPAIDPDYPATLSPAMLTSELRQNLQFAGLIVTDALIMGAITQRYGPNEAAVLAVAAGADIVLMPADPVGAIEALVQAVETGRIAIEQIHTSLDRIWAAKQKIQAFPAGNAHAWEAVPPPALAIDQLAQPATLNTAAQILQGSLQVHQLAKLETQSEENKRNLIIIDDVLNCSFLARHTPAIAIPQSRGYRLQIIDNYTPNAFPIATSEYSSTLLQLFIRSNPFRDTTGLSQLATTWVEFLVKTHQLQALILYGSPYVLASLTRDLPDTVPYLFSYGQMEAAQSIALATLFGTQPHQGGDREFTD